MYIGQLKLENPIFCAPMAGVSDLPYRLIMKRHGASLVYTEMISANGLFYGGNTTRKLLLSRNEERPLAVQLFGEDPDLLSKAALEIEDQADLIDLNLGCPVRKVVRSGAGSALLRAPLQVSRILSSLRKTTQRPLSVKIRSGWDNEHINFIEIARIAFEEGIDAVTLHPRTRSQMFGGQADWDHIRVLKKTLSIPVIGSGDLFDPFKIKTMFAETNCDAVMVGRGGYGNPWIISQALELLSGKKIKRPTSRCRFETAVEHLNLSTEILGPEKTLAQMRKHLCWYVRGLESAASFRAQINTSRTIEEMNDILERFFTDVS